MHALRSWFVPPRSSEGPLARMRWIRRIEIGGGVWTLIIAAMIWSDVGAWHWLLLGSGLLALSPWPGPGAIARKAEKRPDVLIADPERRRARLRRTLAILVPAQVALFAIIGFAMLGTGGAVFMAAFGGVSGALGAWLSTKLEAR
jgi:hypothetical protein